MLRAKLALSPSCLVGEDKNNVWRKRIGHRIEIPNLKFQIISKPRFQIIETVSLEFYISVSGFCLGFGASSVCYALCYLWLWKKDGFID